MLYLTMYGFILSCKEIWISRGQGNSDREINVGLKGPLKETLNNQTRLAIGLIGIGIIGPQNCNRCHSTGLQI